MKGNKAICIISIFSILIIFIYSCRFSEPVKFIIPEGYVGYIIIIFNQKNGEPVKYHNKTRLYEIPANGVLKTQFTPQNGFSQLPLFYYAGETTKKQIPVVTTMKNQKHDSLVAYIGYVGTANVDLKGDTTISFSVCFIGTPSQIDSAYAIANKLDIRSLVQ